MTDNPKEKELERLHKYGSILPTGDIIGIWLRESLVGKRVHYLTNSAGEVVDKPDAPGVYGINYVSNSEDDPFMSCTHEIRLIWDQWVVCYIECLHGKFEGVSDFFNVTEAIMRAISAFNEADHPSPPDEDDSDNEN
jgi:hypothetical protein